jgi:hypothetical protein
MSTSGQRLRKQLGGDGARKSLEHDLAYTGPLEPWFAKTWRPGEIKLQS